MGVKRLFGIRPTRSTAAIQAEHTVSRVAMSAKFQGGKNAPLPTRDSTNANKWNLKFASWEAVLTDPRASRAERHLARKRLRKGGFAKRIAFVRTGRAIKRSKSLLTRFIGRSVPPSLAKEARGESHDASQSTAAWVFAPPLEWSPAGPPRNWVYAPASFSDVAIEKVALSDGGKPMFPHEQDAAPRFTSFGKT